MSLAPASDETAPYDIGAVRAQFPILAERGANGAPLAYLDNAATTQKPLAVIEAIDAYYRRDNANVHRAVHTLSQRATEAYEAARQEVATFLSTRPDQVVFTRGTTEALNLVAHAWGGAHLRPGDEILLTELEHHSAIVPWQLVAARTGARVVPAPILPNGALDLAGTLARLTPRTRVLGLTLASNALGTITPVEALAERARAIGALVVVDAAQAAPHLPLDPAAIGADFLAFSGHKVYGPTGIGALWGRAERLAETPPWQGGGDMIERVSFDGSTWAEPPARFEAGTPHIAGAVGLGAATAWLRSLGLERVGAWEHQLLELATARLSAIPGVRLVGTAPRKVAVVSFVVAGADSQDVGTLLNEAGVAVRTGHHCAQPLMHRLGVPSTARASFAAYNTPEEVERLADALRTAVRILT